MKFKPIVALLALVLLLPVVVFGGRSIITYFSNAAPLPANIVVDASKSQATLSRPWDGLSQGGEQEEPGKLVSLGPVESQIKSLKVQYIRIDHVLENPFNESYRQRIQEIVNSGAIPIISLSYFPTDVADSNIGTARNFPAWQNHVRNLVQSVSGRNGMNIAGVYYEVWNEPDGEGFGKYSVGEGKDYFELYQKTVQAVLSAQNVNSFKVGGPALADLRRCTNGLLFICQSYWLDEFLRLVAKNNVRLDFISWHRYSTKVSDYQEDVNFINDLYIKYSSLPPAEKIISEWGSVPQRSALHNSAYDAAQLVAAARTFIGYVDLATKFEVRDGPDSKDQGWGILTYDGGKKPTYFALGLLNRLRAERVLLLGENAYVSGIASRDNSGVSVIIVNYDGSGGYADKVPVKITNLVPGNYRLIKTTLNSSFPSGHDEVSTINLTGGTYNDVENLVPNTVVLYDLQLVALVGG